MKYSDQPAVEQLFDQIRPRGAVRQVTCRGNGVCFIWWQDVCTKVFISRGRDTLNFLLVEAIQEGCD